MTTFLLFKKRVSKLSLWKNGSEYGISEKLKAAEYKKTHKLRKVNHFF